MLPIVALVIFAVKLYVPSKSVKLIFEEFTAHENLGPSPILTQIPVPLAICIHFPVKFTVPLAKNVLFTKNVTLKLSAGVSHPVIPVPLRNVTLRNVCPNERFVKFDPEDGDTILIASFVPSSAITKKPNKIAISKQLKITKLFFFIMLINIFFI